MKPELRTRLVTAARLAAFFLLPPLSGAPFFGGRSLRYLVGDGIAAGLKGGEAFDPLAFSIGHHAVDLLYAIWFVGAFFAGLGLVGGGLVRLLARARVRAGHADPLDRLRRPLARWPRAASAVTTILPALVFTALVGAGAARIALGAAWELVLPQIALPAGFAFLLASTLLRRGARALLAPTLAVDASAARAADAEGFTFDAVAITPHTLGAVAAMAALTVAALAAVTSAQTVALLRHGAAGPFLGAYVAIALGGAFLFARRSKIAIGLDGVLVGGTTKTRFYAYRDIDHARANADILELRKGTRVVLRLQLHGADAGRRDAIVERLEAAITAARAGRADPAAAFVEAASVAELTRAAEGAASYRFTTPTRDKLWEVFESPALAAEARRAAAEALAVGLGADERARYRVAAENIAEPVTRRRLAELVPATGIESSAEPDREDAAPARKLAAVLPR